MLNATLAMRHIEINALMEKFNELGWCTSRVSIFQENDGPLCLSLELFFDPLVAVADDDDPPA